MASTPRRIATSASRRRNVTLAEAATLAGLLKAPARYSPLLDREAGGGARARSCSPPCTRTATSTTARRASRCRSEVKPVRDVAGGSGRYVADWVMAQLPVLCRRDRRGHRRRHHHRPPRLQAAAARARLGDARRGGRQIRRQPGRDRRHGPDRRGQGDGRRPRLRREPVQPRRRRACASRARPSSRSST